MCNLSKCVEEKGILIAIRNLMKTMVWSAEQVMRGLKIPDSERIKYMFQIKKKKL